MVVIVTSRNVHLVGMREENERESVVVVIVMYSDVSVKMQILYRNHVYHQVNKTQYTEAFIIKYC